jgi:cytochrome c554/c'-like protein
MGAFKDSGHLFRLAIVFALGLVLFIGVRSIFVPKTFGEYGHFRGAAIADIAARPVAYAGRQSCEDCHADVVQKKNTGKHVRIGCEACHGPLAKHVDDPASVQPEKLDTAVLCVRCHEANIAKPAGFPQVKAEEHSSGLACDTCHQPHAPSIAKGAGQ